MGIWCLFHAGMRSGTHVFAKMMFTNNNSLRGRGRGEFDPGLGLPFFIGPSKFAFGP